MSMTGTKGEHFAPKEEQRGVPETRRERGKHRPPRKKPAGTGTVVFRAIYISVTALAVAAVVAGLFVLWDFLAEYEQLLPEKVVESVLAGLEQGETASVYESAGFTPNPYEDDSAAREYVAGLFKGELSYSKDVKLSTDEAPVYAVKCGGKRVCSLTLEQTGEKSGWGFPRYRAAGFSGVEIPTGSITITAPDSAELRINGVLLRELPESSEQVRECEHFYGYIDRIPEIVQYTVEGFAGQPEVTATSGEGAYRREQSGSEYRFTRNVGEIPQELSELAVKVSQTYSKYISADAAFSAVAAYVPEDVPLYENIRTYEAKFYTPHSDYDFLDVQVSDFRRYTEECVSLRVTYTQRIYAGYLGDFDFPTDNTIYLAKNGEEWVATDIVMN